MKQEAIQMTKKLVERGNTVLSAVLGRFFSDLEVSHGKGCYLFGLDGKKYLDFASGIAVTSTGHCHPKVVKAIKKQAETLIHACIGIAYYEPPIKLAEMLAETLGGNLNSVFFTQSGSEAVETAIKLAKYTSGKSKILAFKGAFHGRTTGALSITSSKEKYTKGYEPLLEGILSFPFPRCYRCPWNKDKNTCENYCSLELEEYINNLDNDVAAAIIEPILGEGGYVLAPDHFLMTLKKICNKKNILLIFDEIQTGVGRTGNWFAFQNYNVEPDIITLAKGMGSGLPLGACIAQKELMDQWHAGAHGGTYGGNPLTCAAGVATLEVLEKNVDKVQKLGGKAITFLEEKLADNPFIGDIRGAGLMIGIEFVKNKATKEPYPEIIRKVMTTCLEKGLIIISCGMEDNVIRIIPPLIIKEKELFQGLTLLTEVINATN
jgi:4-aminobutyrate aminotransferase